MELNLLKTCLAVLAIHASTATIGVSQDAIEEIQPEITREQWKTRIEAARRRADEMRRERINLASPEPTGLTSDEELSRRVIEDDSLQPGDIVSTNRGLFRFKGQRYQNREPGDFVPMAAQPSPR